jgi:hypothetical protein
VEAIEPNLLAKTMLRFAAGGVLSVLAGMAIFPDTVFDLMNPTSQCVTVGLLAAGILALVRVRRPAAALGLIVANALLQLAVSWKHGAAPAFFETTWSLLMGGGIFLAAVIYDGLAARNIRFGKFMVLGSMCAGAYFAATPVALLGHGLQHPVGAELTLNAFLGLIIGDAVGLGMELVELLPWLGLAPVPRTPLIVASRADVPDTD